MILICPQCATRYEADAANFQPAGRKVRCAKCSHVWHQDPPEPEAAMPVAVAAPQAPRAAAFVAPVARVSETRPVAVTRPPSRRLAAFGLGLGWVALVAVILVIGVSALTWREQIASQWPRTASLYASLGLTVNPTGIGFADVTHAQQTEDGQAVLAISGKLVNLSSRTVSVPPIEVTLTDSDKHAVLRKSFSPSIATLQPGQIATFLARLSSPPAAARHLELRFAAQ